MLSMAMRSLAFICFLLVHTSAIRQVVIESTRSSGRLIVNENVTDNKAQGSAKGLRDLLEEEADKNDRGGRAGVLNPLKKKNVDDLATSRGNLTDSLPCGDGQIAIFKPSGPIEQNSKKLDILDMRYAAMFYRDKPFRPAYAAMFYRDKPFRPAMLDLRGIFTETNVITFDVMASNDTMLVGGRRFLGGYTDHDAEEYKLDRKARSSSLDMLNAAEVNWRIEVPVFYDPTSLGFHCVGNCVGVENPSEPVLLVHGWDPEVEIVKRVFEWLYFQAPPMLNPNPEQLVVFTNPEFICK